MLTYSQVRNLFETDGKSVAEWSRQNGFPSALVYRVLRGEAKCRRGVTHRIALALGIKAPASEEQRKLLKMITEPHQTTSEMEN
jgi:gp16 family phage-associated protein